MPFAIPSFCKRKEKSQQVMSSATGRELSQRASYTTSFFTEVHKTTGMKTLISEGRAKYFISVCFRTISYSRGIRDPIRTVVQNQRTHVSKNAVTHGRTQKLQ